MQCGHEEAPQPLPERVRPGEPLQFGDDRTLVALRQARLVPVLQRLESQLLQPGGLGLCPWQVLEACERRAHPESQRAIEQSNGLLRSVARRPPRRDQVQLEAVGIHRIERHLEQVARRPAPERHARIPRVPCDESPELRDGGLQSGAGGRRRILAPQRLAQPVQRDDLTTFRQQGRQQQALPRSAERHGPGFAEHINTAEHPELHEPIVSHEGRHRQPGDRQIADGSPSAGKGAVARSSGRPEPAGREPNGAQQCV